MGFAALDETRWSDITLANGLRAIVVPDASSTNVAISVAYHVGGKDDPPGRSGFAHLFEHLMFKGTKKTPPETIDRLTEDIGGFNNAYTSADLTVYYEVVPANYTETMIWAEADRLASLVVDQGHFDTERNVVISEYDQRVLADPYGKLDEFIERQMFGDHAYAQGVIGDPESLRAASLEDVLQFHQTYYRPDNAVVAIVGGIDVDQTTAWVEEYFGAVALPASAIPRPAPFTVRPAPTRLSYSAANVPLTVVNLMYYAPGAKSPDSPLIDLLDCIMSAGRSSRLHQALIHTRRLVSQVSVDSDLREHAGLVQLRATVHDDAQRDAVEQILRDEVRRVCEDGVTDDEVRRARNQLATMLVRHGESINHRSLNAVSDTWLRGDPWAIKDDARVYAEATAADIQALARTIFADEPAIYEYRSGQ